MSLEHSRTMVFCMRANVYHCRECSQCQSGNLGACEGCWNETHLFFNVIHRIDRLTPTSCVQFLPPPPVIVNPDIVTVDESTMKRSAAFVLGTGTLLCFGAMGLLLYFMHKSRTYRTYLAV